MPPKIRRSQAERSALTRGRILDVDNFVTLDLTGGRRAAGVESRAGHVRQLLADPLQLGQQVLILG